MRYPMECDILRYSGLVFVLFICTMGSGGDSLLLRLAETLRPSFIVLIFVMRNNEVSSEINVNVSIEAVTTGSINTKQLLMFLVSC